ncbi:tigger transposable element-derived protein 1 [Nephila pilipes]|uniref:Tigger transposable element-derived protein 1 n=1 Tax=Nephila pilipes TaxID=299642 RepID=A0A8X6IVG5_NEPPI|nr:tigger transposable element-derived protein 1 [Nephila pilipes]
MSMAAILLQYPRSSSRRKLQPSKGVTIISKLRTNTHDEMEQLLLLWIKEKQLAGDSVSEAIICEKAGAIFQDLKRDVIETEGESSQGGEGFKACRGWFDNLRNEVAFIQLFIMEKHLVEIQRRLKISLRFLKNSLVKKDTYRNKCSIVTKLGYFGKNIPRRTFVTAEEKSLPGHKAMKDRSLVKVSRSESQETEAKKARR